VTIGFSKKALYLKQVHSLRNPFLLYCLIYRTAVCFRHLSCASLDSSPAKAERKSQRTMSSIPLLKRATGSRTFHIVNKTGNVHTCNTEACSCNHCCSGKSVRITYFECVSVVLKYPACNAHAPYCHLWPVRLYSIFPHYLLKGTIFEKKKLNIKCGF